MYQSGLFLPITIVFSHMLLNRKCTADLPTFIENTVSSNSSRSALSFHLNTFYRDFSLDCFLLHTALVPAMSILHVQILPCYWDYTLFESKELKSNGIVCFQFA